MKFSHRWCMIVVLLLDLAAMVSFLSAQTEEPSAVNDPSSAEVQPDSVEAQPSSDDPAQKQPKQPTLVPDKDTASDVEISRLYNEFRSKFLDDRAKMVDWWLEATAIFLTLLGVAAAILGYFGFKRLDRIESEARENVEASEQHAQEAQRYKEEAQSDLETIKEEAQRYVEDIKMTLGKIKIDRAVSEAILLQQQNRTDEAIEKWHSIATITEETGDERAAEAWFNVGYFKSVKGEDFKEALDAYDKAIDLNLSGPNLPYAYFNRGKIKALLGQTESAIADFDAAIDQNSSHADFYIERGVAKQKSGDSEGAMADFDAAIGLSPSEASTHSRVGSLKVLSGRIDEARPHYEKALDLAREEGNADLTAQVESILEDLDRREAP